MKVRGFTCLQTEDTASAGNKLFIERETFLCKRYETKSAKFLDNGTSIMFNGANIRLIFNGYFITQEDHKSKLSKIAEQKIDKSEFVAQRARGAYIAAVCRPDLTFGFAHASQIVNPDATAFKALKKFIEHAKEQPGVGLKYVSIGTTTAKLVVFSDASFAFNADMTSQLGFVIALADRFENENILHYTSVKSKRVTRSVLASEHFAAVNAFVSASTIRVFLNDLFGRIIPLVLHTNSKSLYDSIKILTERPKSGFLLIYVCYGNRIN